MIGFNYEQLATHIAELMREHESQFSVIKHAYEYLAPALDAGVPQAKLVEALNIFGLPISLAGFKSALQRIRKELGLTAPGTRYRRGPLRNQRAQSSHIGSMSPIYGPPYTNHQGAAPQQVANAALPIFNGAQLHPNYSSSGPAFSNVGLGRHFTS